MSLRVLPQLLLPLLHREDVRGTEVKTGNRRMSPRMLPQLPQLLLLLRMQPRISALSLLLLLPPMPQPLSLLLRLLHSEDALEVEVRAVGVGKEHC
jgi:hypothetical protein